MDYDDWQAKFAAQLRAWGGDVDARWDALLESLVVGAEVTGTVMFKAHFGAWVDIGRGFPALIELPYIRGLTPEKYRADDWCREGSAITARVVALSPHQIRLAQVRRVWASPSEDERTRLAALVEPLTSLAQTLAALGEPDEDFAPGLLSFPDGSRHRVLTYYNLSSTARVIVVDRGSERPDFQFSDKCIGEEDVS